MDDESFDDLRDDGEDFAPGLEAPVPDADYRIAPAADAARPPRGEAHREAQRKGAINQWKARDRREGVPQPVESAKAPPPSKRGAIEALLLKKMAEQPHITRAIEEYVSATVADLGGWDRLSAGQRAMLICQKTTLLIILACEDEVVQSGGVSDENGEPHHLLGVLRVYLATFRQGEVSLGLGLRSRMPRDDNQTISKIMSEYAQRRAGSPLLVPEKPKSKTPKKAG